MFIKDLREMIIIIAVEIMNINTFKEVDIFFFNETQWFGNNTHNYTIA